MTEPIRICAGISAIAVASCAFAQVEMAPDANFKTPVEVLTGETTFSKVIYPSPVLIDIDNDGIRELVVGDLFGHIVAAKPASAGEVVDPASGWLGAENLKVGDKNLKLNNW